MKYPFLVALVFCFCTACTDHTSEDSSSAILLPETPDALRESGSGYSLRSVSKRYDKGVIERLYQEALDKNEELKALNKQIQSIGEQKNDGLSPYNQYVLTNGNYWSEVERYISGIKDSTLLQSTRQAFAKMEDRYQSTLTGHESQKEAIFQKTEILNDQLILMKLFISLPMMQNYQANELPDIKLLENLVQEYDKLIEDTKASIQ